MVWKLISSSSKNVTSICRPDVTLQTFKIMVCNLYQSVDMKIFPVVVQILKAALNLCRSFFYLVSFHRFFISRPQMPTWPYATLKTLILMVLMRTMLDQT